MTRSAPERSENRRSDNRCFVSSAGTGWDYATIKYDGTTGTQLWVARYNGPANRDDYSWALALDADGNVFVIGAVDGAGTERWEVIRDELNRYLRGWGAYFAYDSHWPSFRKLDQHVWDRARNFLRRRHRQSRAEPRLPPTLLYDLGELGQRLIVTTRLLAVVTGGGDEGPVT